MAVAKIVVTDIIKTGSLFADQGWDTDKSADNLAELKGRIIVDFLSEKYPGTEIFADIAIQNDGGQTRPLEVLLYQGGEESFPVVDKELQRQLTCLIDEAAADRNWAVRAE